MKRIPASGPLTREPARLAVDHCNHSDQGKQQNNNNNNNNNGTESSIFNENDHGLKNEMIWN